MSTARVILGAILAALALTAAQLTDGIAIDDESQLMSCDDACMAAEIEQDREHDEE